MTKTNKQLMAYVEKHDMPSMGAVEFQFSVDIYGSVSVIKIKKARKKAEERIKDRSCSLEADACNYCVFDSGSTPPKEAGVYSFAGEMFLDDNYYGGTLGVLIGGFFKLELSNG